MSWQSSYDKYKKLNSFEKSTEWNLKSSGLHILFYSILLCYQSCFFIAYKNNVPAIYNKYLKMINLQCKSNTIEFY